MSKVKTTKKEIPSSKSNTPEKKTSSTKSKSAVKKSVTPKTKVTAKKTSSTGPKIATKKRATTKTQNTTQKGSAIKAKTTKKKSPSRKKLDTAGVMKPIPKILVKNKIASITVAILFVLFLGNSIIKDGYIFSPSDEWVHTNISMACDNGKPNNLYKTGLQVGWDGMFRTICRAHRLKWAKEARCDENGDLQILCN